MKRRPPCRSEFNRGLTERRKFPLHTGHYKLNECDRYPSRILQLLKDVAETSSTPEFDEICSYEDAGETLRIAPDSLSFDLGWRFLPAIEALPGDGVPGSLVASRLPAFQYETLQLVDLLQETADEFAQTSMRRELKLIRARYVSSLVYPCRRYQDLIDEAKALAKNAGPIPPHVERPTKLRNVVAGARRGSR